MIVESLSKRRSIYALDKNLPVDAAEIVRTIERVTELVPDAFDMKSARVLIAFGARHERLWDAAHDAFEGKVPREKIAAFKSAAGTVLYFIDNAVVRSLQSKYAIYAENFPVWANHANAMLQLSIWTALRDLGVGANIQHYNPIIDGAVEKLFGIPSDWQLISQMPFGGIVSEPEPKPIENIKLRVRVEK